MMVSASPRVARHRDSDVAIESHRHVQFAQRITYLDGIRALAAFRIVVFHLFQMRGFDVPGVTADLAPSGEGIGAFYLVLFGVLKILAWSVETFIVLSGYSLMIGIIHAPDGQPKGGLRGYFMRRIWRIWPPYYIALTLSLLIIALVPGMGIENGSYQDQAIPVTTEGLLTHLVFLHTLSPSTSTQINTPMWTLAVEEQIAVIFPLLLLPFWRRFSAWTMLPVAALVPLLGAIFLPYPNFLEMRPWFLVLFATGAVASSISFSSRKGDVWLREHVPWPWVAVVALAVWAGLKAALPRLMADSAPVGYLTDPITDPVIGAAIASAFIHWTKTWQRGAPKVSFVRLFSLPVLLWVGSISYSLYLLHAPVLSLLTLLLRSLGFNDDRFFTLMLVGGLPVVMAVAWVFYRFVEQRFRPPKRVTAP